MAIDFKFSRDYSVEVPYLSEVLADPNKYIGSVLDVDQIVHCALEPWRYGIVNEGFSQAQLRALYGFRQDALASVHGQILPDGWESALDGKVFRVCATNFGTRRQSVAKE